MKPLSKTALAICLLASTLASGCARNANSSLSASGDRVLVVIVPGTFSGAAFWPTAQAGKASFASELKRAIGDNCEIYPALWASSIEGPSLRKAGQTLAWEIDQEAVGFDRVCIVGHSHGGNIALLAAGMCKSPIDMIACLSTPHAHLRMKPKPSGNDELLVPVYCSPNTLNNTGTIVTICPTTDDVPEFWANVLPMGLNDGEAIELVKPWRDATDDPRLRRDGILLRLLRLGNVETSKRLNVESIHIDLHSLVLDQMLGLKGHSTVHSCRMGYVVGELLRDGAASERIAYLQHMVQPKNTDDGEPVATAVYQRWLAQYDQYFEHAGWRLEDASVTVSAGQDLYNTPPDLRLLVKSGDGRQTWGQTEPQENALTARWQPGIFVYESSEFLLCIEDHNGLLPARSLGNCRLTANRDLPTSISPNASASFRWSGEFQWTPMHH